jgi:hypothetical protein
MIALGFLRLEPMQIVHAAKKGGNIRAAPLAQPTHKQLSMCRLN